MTDQSFRKSYQMQENAHKPLCGWRRLTQVFPVSSVRQRRRPLMAAPVVRGLQPVVSAGVNLPRSSNLWPELRPSA